MDPYSPFLSLLTPCNGPPFFSATISSPSTTREFCLFFSFPPHFLRLYTNQSSPLPSLSFPPRPEISPIRHTYLLSAEGMRNIPPPSPHSSPPPSHPHYTHRTPEYAQSFVLRLCFTSLARPSLCQPLPFLFFSPRGFSGEPARRIISFSWQEYSCTNLLRLFFSHSTPSKKALPPPQFPLVNHSVSSTSGSFSPRLPYPPAEGFTKAQRGPPTDQFYFFFPVLTCLTSAKVNT